MEEKYGKLNETFREKNQTSHTIKDENNNRIEYSFHILEEYKKYYKNLLKTRQADTAQETDKV